MIKKKEEKKVKKYNRVPKKKKKFNILTKILFSVFLLISIVFSYFLIIISTQEKSIPLITRKVSSSLEKILHQKVTLKNTAIQITNRANLRLNASNLEIIDENNFKTTIPKISIEIPIFSAIFGNFSPNKLLIKGAVININTNKEAKKSPNNSANIDISSSLIDFLNSLQKTYFGSSFQIQNSKVIMGDKTIEISDFSIVVKYRKKSLNISINGEFFDKNRNITSVESACYLKKNNELSCDAKFKDFSPKSLANINNELQFLNKIDAIFAGEIKVLANKSGFQDLEFDVLSNNGAFSYDGFFDKKISFNKANVSGIYNHSSKFLNLSNIDIEFSKNKNYSKISQNPNLKMSLAISYEKDLEMLFDINLANIAINDLDIYWPNSLSQNGIRDWLIEHGKNGFITKSNAKFSLKNNDLKNINATIDLKGYDLKYSPIFPEIKNIEARAEFSKKNMLITVFKAKVLETRIYNSLVKIDDFFANNIILEIDGKSSGHGSDLLQHVSYDSDFSVEIKKLLNGSSDNKFNVKIPLSKIDINSLELSIFSNVKSVKNDYILGDVVIDVNKKAFSDNFIVKFDNSNAKINSDIFGIDKEKNVKSNFNFVVEVKNLEEITIKDIIIDEISSNNRKYIEGKVKFNISPFKITAIDFENKNFSQNDYHILYNNLSKKISVNADTINFRTILNKKPNSKKAENSSDFSIIDLQKIQIVANKLLLPNQKVLNDFYLFFNCNSGLCSEGIVKLLDKKNQFFELNVAKNYQDNFSIFNASIPNVGNLIRAIGISNLVEKGNAKITAKNIAIAGKFVLEGTMEIDNDMTFYENDAIKLLDRDNLFHQIKDKIFSNQKTTFNKIRINFLLKDNILEIKSLIASNYKIGITAKGTINLNDESYNIKGSIIPGYLVNNLFGVGSIPVVGNITSLITGGKDGGIFGLQYELYKQKDGEFTFKTNKISSLLPTTINNLIDMI